MTTRQRNFGIILGADMPAKRLRTGRRDNVIVEGIYVQDGCRDRSQVDAPFRENELALHKLVVLVKILQPLLGGFTGMRRPVREPFLHAEKRSEERRVGKECRL